MKILVDENIPNMTVAALRAVGHDVRDLRGTSMEGSADEVVWEIAVREGRLLVTTDKMFGQRRHEVHEGILVVRLSKPSRLAIHERVMAAFARFRPEEWRGVLVVMRDRAQTVWRSALSQQ